MLSTNIFYSGYNVFFSVLSLFIGLGAIFLVRDSKIFRSLLLFQLGSLALVLLTYLTVHDHVLYRIGLNYNFVAFVQVLISLIISVLWINSAAYLHRNFPANREALAVYMALGLTICVYHCFCLYGCYINYRSEYTPYLSASFTIIGIVLLFVSCLVKLWHERRCGNFILAVSLFMLGGKLVVSAFFYQYNWLNLNIFNWVWIYVFAAAVVFMRFDMYDEELQKCWNSIDKLNLQLINIIDSAPDPVLVLRRDNFKVMALNSKAAMLLGTSRKEALYRSLEDFFIDKDNLGKFTKQLAENGQTGDFDLLACNIVSGSPFWLSASAKYIEYKNTPAIYMVMQDVALRKEREASLRNISDRDPLTACWNMRYFEKVAVARAKECVKNGQNFSFLLLDADKFKKLNEKYGHKACDSVLVKIADTCRNSVREDDIVARYGGEEFIIFLENTDSRAAMRVAERLRQTMEDTFVKNDDDEIIKFTVSIGVVSSEKTASVELLLRQVDDAMYQAKRAGRNKTALYDEQKARHRGKSSRRNVHPVFKNEEDEEISLLDSYENM